MARHTVEKKIKKSSHPSLLTIWRAVTFKPTVAMAIPVNTQPTTLTFTARLSLKSTSVFKPDMVFAVDSE